MARIEGPAHLGQPAAVLIGPDRSLTFHNIAISGPPANGPIEQTLHFIDAMIDLLQEQRASFLQLNAMVLVQEAMHNNDNYPRKP